MRIVLTTMVSLLMTAGAAWGDTQALPGAAPRKSAGAADGESEVERETISTNALISVKPHLQLIGETSVGVAWTTRVKADGWVEWSQDGGATWRKAWNQRDGLKVDANDCIHKVVVEGFDPAKPLKYRVRSRACTSFGQCEVGHSGERGCGLFGCRRWLVGVRRGRCDEDRPRVRCDGCARVV